jgi:hypothetical protein
MINNVNLMKPNPAQPVDLQTQQMLLAQQSAIAQALIAKSMEDSSPIIHTGGGNPFARDIPNFQDPVARVTQAMMGARQRDEANRGQAALNEELQRRSTGEQQSILGARFGQLEPPNTAVDDEGNVNPPVQGKGSILRALQLATNATTPAGKGMMAEMLKGLLSNEEAYKGMQNFDPATVQKALQTQDLGDVKPAVQVKEYEGAARPYQGGVPIGPATAINTFTNPEVNPVTGLPLSKSEVTNKPTALTGGNVTPARAKDIKEAEATIEELKKGMEGYRKDVATMSNIAQAEYELSKAPENALGIASWFRNNLSKAAELIGLEKTGAVPTLEKLHQALGNLTIDKVRLLAPVSDSDFAKLQNILGTESNTKRALEGMMQIMATATARNMGLHRDFVRASAQDPEMTKNPDAFLQKWAPDFRIDPVQHPASVDVDLRKKYGIPN